MMLVDLAACMGPASHPSHLRPRGYTRGISRGSFERVWIETRAHLESTRKSPLRLGKVYQGRVRLHLRRPKPHWLISSMTLNQVYFVSPQRLIKKVTCIGFHTQKAMTRSIVHYHNCSFFRISSHRFAASLLIPRIACIPRFN